MKTIQTLCVALGMVLLASAVEAATADVQRNAGDVYATSTEQLHSLAENGDSDAQYKIGSLYDRTQHLIKDCKEAERWYRLAAMQGHAVAQFRLGFLLSIGTTSIPKNLREGLKWMELAAAQGLPFLSARVQDAVAKPRFSRDSKSCR